MSKKILMLVSLLVFVSFIFAYYKNMQPNISIDCYLEYEKPASNENPDKKNLAINIDTKVKDFNKYKSIDIDYTYGSLSDYIIGILETKTEESLIFEDYESNISITLIPEALNYDKVKEMLKDEFLKIELETIKGHKYSKSYSIGKMLVDKTE